ncbi:MAG: sigma-70 family RNA polymerase sigma factor [Verrucomicrobiales bacterium]
MKRDRTANQPFPTTRWTLITRVAGGDDARKAEALEELCRIYWPPVYAFIRSKGASPTDAEDLTQGFFAEFLRREDFGKAQSERGNLRSFILKSVQNFMANDWRDRKRLKRGGEARLLSIDVDGSDGRSIILEPEDNTTPEIIFQRQWALSVLHRVVECLRERYVAKGRGDLFEALKFVINTNQPDRSYSEIANEFGMKEGAVKMAAHRLRERYGRLLKETIADTLVEGSDVDEELRELMNAF